MGEIEINRSIGEPVFDEAGKQIGVVEHFIEIKPGAESVSLSGVKNFGIFMDGGGSEFSIAQENTKEYEQ